MVGRLVQQQDIGRGRQHARQRRAAGLAAGEMRGVLIAVKPELLQHIAGLIVVVARAEPGLDIGQRGGEAGKIGLLRQIADGRAGLHETAAAVGLDQAGRDLQQRRFAGTVAADQADALAPPTPTVRRPTTAACRRRSARCPSTGSAEAPWFRFNLELVRFASARWRWMRRMVWSSADRNAERSRGAKDLGPPVTSPDERRSVIRLRTASVIPIDCFRERLAVRRDHLGSPPSRSGSPAGYRR